MHQDLTNRAKQLTNRKRIYYHLRQKCKDEDKNVRGLVKGFEDSQEVSSSLSLSRKPPLHETRPLETIPDRLILTTFSRLGTAVTKRDSLCSLSRESEGELTRGEQIAFRLFGRFAIPWIIMRLRRRRLLVLSWIRDDLQSPLMPESAPKP